MPSTAEKERRINAAQKRKDEAKERYEKFTKKAQEAHSEIEREEEMLQWLKGMPVDDEVEGEVEGEGDVEEA